MARSGAKKSFGDHVRERLDELNMGQIELAHKIGTATGTLRNWICASRNARIGKNWQRSLARALGVSVETLREWGVEDGMNRTRTLRLRLETFVLTQEELVLLVEAQKVLGDLSLKMAIEHVQDHRAKKNQTPPP